MRPIASGLSSLLLAFSLLCPALAAPAEASKPRSRTEANGFVTMRLTWPDYESLSWSDAQHFYVLYADTQEPVPLSSTLLYQGNLYVTIPAEDAERPLELLQGTPVQFTDCVQVWQGHTYYDAPQGADQLNLRGILQGDSSGTLNKDRTLTRAEAFALLCRLLSLQPEGDPGYRDVAPGDWYYEIASAARTAGLAAPGEQFAPDRPVSRAELTVMTARAFRILGWLAQSDAAPAFADAESIPSWAYSAYCDLDARGISLTTQVSLEGTLDASGEPTVAFYAHPSVYVTRGEAVEFLYSALRFLPVYPTPAAIEWGFDKAMPVIDGSTSTYPYTRALYSALFLNYDGHPTMPAAHSKSYYSYDRLISGEADFLIISTKPTEDTLKKAKAAGVTLELTPIAHDAMVFFTNGQNSIAGLSSQQIRSIYVDNSIANWAELGAPDAVFIPYCRNRDSGSQAQMEEFFLNGSEIHPSIRRETTSVSMASVLTDVEDAYCADPLSYALGYSIYYYYQTAAPIMLSSEEGLKLLAIDGVYPTDATIADGTYPLAGYNYAVVRADEPKDSPARKMVQFLLSEAGQQCVENAGFGPLF